MVSNKVIQNTICEMPST